MLHLGSDDEVSKIALGVLKRTESDCKSQKISFQKIYDLMMSQILVDHQFADVLNVFLLTNVSHRMKCEDLICFFSSIGLK